MSSEILGELAVCDYGNEEEKNSLQKKVLFFFEMIKGHTRWEEAFVFKQLPQEKIEEELLAHKILEAKMGDLRECFKQGASSPEKLHHIYLQYRKFHSELLQHLYEEEVEIVPALREKLGEEGLRRIDFDIYKEMSSEEMVAMAKDLFPPCSFLEKKAILEDLFVANQSSLKAALPKIKTHFSKREWSQILSEETYARFKD